MPEAEQALVLICQGLFKKAVLVGFSVMLANKCEVSPGMLKNVSTFSYKHTVKTRHKVTGGCVSQGSLKSTVFSVFMLFGCDYSQIVFTLIEWISYIKCDINCPQAFPA